MCKDKNHFSRSCRIRNKQIYRVELNNTIKNNSCSFMIILWNIYHVFQRICYRSVIKPWTQLNKQRNIFIVCGQIDHYLKKYKITWRVKIFTTVRVSECYSNNEWSVQCGPLMMLLYLIPITKTLRKKVNRKNVWP